MHGIRHQAAMAKQRRGPFRRWMRTRLSTIVSATISTMAAKRAKLLYTTLARPHRGRGQPGLTEAGARRKRCVGVGCKTRDRLRQAVNRMGCCELWLLHALLNGKIRGEGIEDQKMVGLGVRSVSGCGGGEFEGGRSFSAASRETPWARGAPK